MAIFSRPIPGLRFGLSLLSFAAFTGGGLAAESTAPVPLPGTISPEARAVIEFLSNAGLKQLIGPAPTDLAGWKALHAAQEKALEEPNRIVLEQTGATLADDVIGGVPVLDVRPEGWTENGRALIYIHGGAFTLFSARSMAGLAALMAKATGLRVYSIDYTNPPAVQWDSVQAQVAAVLGGLAAKGLTMDKVALWGDSAGGNLALRAVLNLREQGATVPAALVLFSPWGDLSNSGDTAITLAHADPTLSYDGLLANAARAYAGALDLKDPRVSPVYAQFDKEFPPTLIQDGTRTIVLSDSVRVYRALRDHGVDATIDLYEGMWHVFQGAPAPEAANALASAGAFVKARLK
ncbi:alpha/beta hydrolase [Aestuariivirga sp.]|uniref:alpha/beta hydrolase n=1 Tax=Aestuariivirga sp. TaxID=2650926 RepID=UPI003BACC965